MEFRATTKDSNILSFDPQVEVLEKLWRMKITDFGVFQIDHDLLDACRKKMRENGISSTTVRKYTV